MTVEKSEIQNAKPFFFFFFFSKSSSAWLVSAFLPLLSWSLLHPSKKPEIPLKRRFEWSHVGEDTWALQHLCAHPLLLTVKLISSSYHLCHNQANFAVPIQKRHHWRTCGTVSWPRVRCLNEFRASSWGKIESVLFLWWTFSIWGERDATRLLTDGDKWKLKWWCDKAWKTSIYMLSRKKKHISWWSSWMDTRLERWQQWRSTPCWDQAAFSRCTLDGCELCGCSSAALHYLSVNWFHSADKHC